MKNIGGHPQQKQKTLHTAILWGIFIGLLPLSRLILWEQAAPEKDYYTRYKYTGDVHCK